MIGTTLGPYRVLAKLGSGGMGDVYRARDEKLDRDVAVKVLPPALADDPIALERFEREAKSVAHLSHPNILGIFDFGRDGTIAYAVMELLEGETLRERMTANRLPVRRAVDYAIQVAHGLAAAHDKGIVHRDLKPENIFITRDDRVKILDFGLAKPVGPATTEATRASNLLTATGMVVGTVGYMAPEQVRGHIVDQRSDIFSFGTVLYEMLAGRRAFAGDTPADTMSAILNTEPADLDVTSASIPPALDRIVRRCLEKRPELRFHSAHDLAFALETLSSRSSGAQLPVEPVTGRRGSRAWIPWTIAAIASLAAVAPWIGAARTPSRELTWQTFTAITDTAGVETTPTLSPDGSTVAYASRASGTWDIFVQRVGGRTAVPVAVDRDRNELAPAFSPDGSTIAYHDGDGTGGIFLAGATGESSRRLTPFGFHPAWSPDGRRIVFSTEAIGSPYSRLGESELWIVDVAGGAPVRVEGTGDAAQPSFSPSNARIAYWSNSGGQRDIYTIGADGGTRIAVTEDAALDWTPTWSSDGRHVYFASDRGGSMNIWRIAVDEQTGTPAGPAEPVTTGVQASADSPSLSRDGSRLAFRSLVSAVNPVAIPLDPVTLRAGPPAVLSRANNVRHPSAVSRDGRFLALFNLGEPQEDIFISAPDGTGVRRLTEDAPRDRVPIWAPDGKTLYFYSNRGGEWGIWSIGVDGGGLRKLMGDESLYPVISPRGDRLVASAGTGTKGAFVLTLPVASPDTKPTLLPGTYTETGVFVPTDWSPDGRRLAGYVSDHGGRQVAAAVYDLDSSRVRRFDEPAAFVRWLGDNRRIAYFGLDESRFVVLDTESGRRQDVVTALPLRDSREAFALAPDLRTIYYGGLREEADIWIVERK